MTTRKMLSWLLALAVIFSLIPVETLAEALPVPTQPQLQTETPTQEPEELPSEPETIATEPEETESTVPEEIDPVPDETAPLPEYQEPVEVSFSATTADGFLSVEYTEILAAAQKLTVPCFDLTAYGMEQKIDGVSLAHGLIYATEVLCCGVEEQDAGLGYLAQFPNWQEPDGFFRLWGMEGNLSCFVDGALEEEDWASVSLEADSQILLAWLPEDVQAVAGTLSAPDGEISQSLTLHTGENQDVFYAPMAERYSYSGDVTTWLWAGRADEAGMLTLEDLEPGEYCFAIPGKWEEDTCCLPSAVSVTVSGEEPAAALSPVPAVQGDVNGDGVLDTTDGACLAAFVNGTAELSGKGLLLADMNDDGKINMLDVALIYRIVNSDQ